jgi:uncharacterized membrane protein YcaP (DUF421 family)/DNA-directed RNA polymerase subunit RPC12/RpoP
MGMLSPSKTRPLDLGRMFIGDEPPLFLVEVALRTTIIFVYTLLLLRVLGKRGVAQLSLFEVTIIIGLGSAVGDPMFQADVPLFHAMVVIAVIVLLYRLVLALVRKSETFERFVEGEPSCLVSEGRLELKALDKERISQEELFEILRGSGVSQLGEVKRAFIEQSGTVSVFAFAPRQVRSGLPFVPPWDIEEPAVFETGDDEAPLGEYACMACGEKTTRGTAAPLVPCARCTGRRWTEAVRTPLGPEIVSKIAEE